MASRFDFITKQAAKVKHLNGGVIEVGVFRGYSARHLVWALPKKQIHLFDTWEGMDDLVDLSIDQDRWAGYSNVDFEVVHDYLKAQVGDKLFENISFYKGVFPATAEGMEDERFCLAHIDVDLYHSTKDACEWIYPRMVRGGIMMFNDYSCGECPGATKAVDEFFASKPETINCEGTERTEVTIF
jgi:hypothetical protein